MKGNSPKNKTPLVNTLTKKLELLEEKAMLKYYDLPKKLISCPTPGKRELYAES